MCAEEDPDVAIAGVAAASAGVLNMTLFREPGRLM